MEEKARILYVDDDWNMAGTVIDRLKPKGYRIFHFSRGKKAIYSIEHELQYDVAIVDFQLPDIGGDEVIRVSKRINPGIDVWACSVMPSTITRLNNFPIDRILIPSPRKFESILDYYFAHQ